MMSDLFGIRHALREASENILVAETHEGLMREIRLGAARDDIARGFCPDAPFGKGEEWLVETIAGALADVIANKDVAADAQARHIVNKLFKHLNPEGE